MEQRPVNPEDRAAMFQLLQHPPKQVVKGLDPHLIRHPILRWLMADG
jgi:hypothetical protein